ncbi:RluA family pseudouridine synthase [Anaplasma marginale]|uniref:Ribosomal large subunit pseudouridine synthase C n=3 Tax=Anaplasma marginale TaxID=770 RepID=B9KIA4_ANAMF|nr:RluA family pseudouridine synthase [Anaplasma marginale]AAV86511.1 ribosomal large subunit pseudouridine synthase [Anaplasma marginale str. St. Maries]ACM49216.1 ribosomal large subunit pseudouridine synthase (rluC) [Anaplasma marginale str. Florida]
MKREYLVEGTCFEVRVDRYLRGLLPGVTQSFIERLLRRGEILLNNTKAKSSTRVSNGDVLSIKHADRIALREKEIRALQHVPLLDLISGSILYEDKNIIAINKPAGVSVQGGSKVKVSIDDVLDKIKPGECCRIVHRLDKDTSGVLVLARNLDVARYLAREFRERRVKKEYIAVTRGVPQPASGEVSTPIFYKVRSATGESMIEKEAKTFFSVMRILGDCAVVLLRPVTGRKHQLRIHMSQIGCPIVGDNKYHKCDLAEKEMLHLHASLLTFELMGRTLSIAANVPRYMEEKINPL